MAVDENLICPKDTYGLQCYFYLRPAARDIRHKTWHPKEPFWGKKSKKKGSNKMHCSFYSCIVRLYFNKMCKIPCKAPPNWIIADANYLFCLFFFIFSFFLYLNSVIGWNHQQIAHIDYTIIVIVSSQKICWTSKYVRIIFNNYFRFFIWL